MENTNSSQKITPDDIEIRNGGIFIKSSADEIIAAQKAIIDESTVNVENFNLSIEKNIKFRDEEQAKIDNANAVILAVSPSL